MEGCRHQQARSTKGIEAFSANFQAEEDVSFIKNNKGCMMAQSKQKPVNNELSHPADGEAWKQFNKRWKKWKRC
jgi:hypothetical protein